MCNLPSGGVPQLTAHCPLLIALTSWLHCTPAIAHPRRAARPPRAHASCGGLLNSFERFVFLPRPAEFVDSVAALRRSTNLNQARSRAWSCSRTASFASHDWARRSRKRSRPTTRATAQKQSGRWRMRSSGVNTRQIYVLRSLRAGVVVCVCNQVTFGPPLRVHFQ